MSTKKSASEVCSNFSVTQGPSLSSQFAGRRSCFLMIRYFSFTMMYVFLGNFLFSMTRTTAATSCEVFATRTALSYLCKSRRPVTCRSLVGFAATTPIVMTDHTKETRNCGKLLFSFCTQSSL